MTAAPSIVWFRQDLRLADQAALSAAAEAGPLLAVYILDDETPGEDHIGGAQRWWLHHSLDALSADLAKVGVPLVLRRGRCADILVELAREVGAKRVHALRHYEPWWLRAEQEIASRLDLVLHDGNFLAPPTSVLTGGRGRFRIFTPYWSALQRFMPPPPPIAASTGMTGVPAPSDALDDWKLLPIKPNWAGGFDVWQAGEAAANDALTRFVDKVEHYDEARNLPSQVGTSQLSPHLHFGEISPATVWHALGDDGASAPYRRELGWRDFTANLSEQFPEHAREAGRGDKVAFRTGAGAEHDFTQWKRGQTGYPIVDAGMRQLWNTGWMHNRVRMITASFLVKHLLVDWRRGAAHFWDSLIDADYGNNAVNWQWIAGSGVDASQFTRIMAPLVQSEKFGAAEYIRRWVPELAELDDAAIHDPHNRGASPDYPKPIIGHREARERALAAYQANKPN